MGIFGKSAQQKRIDDLAAEVRAKDSTIAGLKESLEKEEGRANRIAGRLSEAEGKLAGERVRRATAEQQLARLTTRGPGGRFVKVANGSVASPLPVPGSASDVSPVMHRSIS